MNQEESIWYLKFCRWTILLSSFGALAITTLLVVRYGTWIEGNPITKSVFEIHPLAMMLVWPISASVIWLMMRMEINGYSDRPSGTQKIVKFACSVAACFALFDLTFDVTAVSYAAMMGWM